jgi:hypothetical protein
VLAVLAINGFFTITFSVPANSPSSRLTSTVSIVVPSNTTKGCPCTEFTFTSGARLLPDVEAAAGCAAAACGKLGERIGVPSAPEDSASGCEALPSVETRFEANRALKASAFSYPRQDLGAVLWAVPLREEATAQQEPHRLAARDL